MSFKNKLLPVINVQGSNYQKLHFQIYDMTQIQICRIALNFDSVSIFKEKFVFVDHVSSKE